MDTNEFWKVNFLLKPPNILNKKTRILKASEVINISMQTFFGNSPGRIVPSPFCAKSTCAMIITRGSHPPFKLYMRQ